jgi:uncharacterized protein (TIGR02246 family)
MPTSNPATIASDEIAVREVPGRIVAAWAQGDAGAFAEVFTEDGTMILPGNVFVQGRDQIQAFMAAGYSGPYKGTRVYGEPVAAKFLGNEAAVLITKGGVLAPGETEVAPERAVRAMWILVKQDGQWVLTAYQITPIGAA